MGRMGLKKLDIDIIRKKAFVSQKLVASVFQPARPPNLLNQLEKIPRGR